jgi:hypothetical protein
LATFNRSKSFDKNELGYILGKNSFKKLPSGAFIKILNDRVCRFFRFEWHFCGFALVCNGLTGKAEYGRGHGIVKLSF